MNKTHRITLIGWTLAMAVCLGFARPSSAQPAKDPANAALAYAKLKTLAGKWEATTDKGKVTTTYQLVSGGTALLERMEMGAGHEMITVYYIDGNRLLLTHYCEAGNQPRMRAGSFDPKTNTIDFQFLDATNLPNPDAGHMHHVAITFQGPNEVDEDWTFYQGSKPGFTVPFVYHRVD
jgi:hypothetical protein